jgi:hypothetical protein
MARTTQSGEETTAAVKALETFGSDLRFTTPPLNVRPTFTVLPSGAVHDRKGNLIYTPETAQEKTQQ